eukprot:4481102-Pyramimonas_sp.AAC.1
MCLFPRSEDRRLVIPHIQCGVLVFSGHSAQEQQHPHILIITIMTVTISTASSSSPHHVPTLSSI